MLSEFDKIVSLPAKHETTTVQAFRISKTEVTRRQWLLVMGTSPWSNERDTCMPPSDECPATNLPYESIDEFCHKLSRMDGRQYRLPSEVEWEYACSMGGRMSRYSSSEISKMAWSEDVTKHDKPPVEQLLDALEALAQPGLGGDALRPVGRKKSNGWGVFDMLGNALEVCSGIKMIEESARFDAEAVMEALPGLRAEIEAHRSEYGILRGGGWQFENVMLRGGSYLNSIGGCQCGVRYGMYPHTVDQPLIGFRVVTAVERSRESVNW